MLQESKSRYGWWQRKESMDKVYVEYRQMHSIGVSFEEKEIFIFFVDLC